MVTYNIVFLRKSSNERHAGINTLGLLDKEIQVLHLGYFLEGGIATQFGITHYFALLLK